MKIGFIGTGNMGGAILKGYISKTGSGENIYAFDIDRAKLEILQREKGVHPCGSIKELTQTCDVILLGVKPNLFEMILPEVAEGYNKEKLLISMAAGVKISVIEGIVGEDAKVIRIMPNTPAMVGEAMTAVCRNKNCSEEDRNRALAVLCTVGKAHEVSEESIHCVIGVSGSSPAYTYMYIEALAQAAAENGMDKSLAITFAAQAVLGAAKMVLETGEDPNQLRDNVCSPGGATIEAVMTLQGNGFADKVKEGFQAAVEKSKRMTK